MKGGIPYPIYESYRNLRQREEIVEAHNFCIYTAELIIKFLASLAIGYYLHKRKEKHPSIDKELLSLKRPSLGNWISILRKINTIYGKDKDFPIPSSIFRNRSDLPQIVDAYNHLREYLSKKPSKNTSVSIFEFLETVGTYRNRTLAHGTVTKSLAEKFLKTLQKSISTVMENLDLEADKRVIYIRRIEVTEDDLYKHYIIDFGEIPPVTVIEPAFITQEKDRKKKDEVYFAIKNEQKETYEPLFRISPFFIYSEREKCFFVLNLSREKEIEFISYATGKRIKPDRLKEKLDGVFSTIEGNSGASIKPPIKITTFPIKPLLIKQSKPPCFIVPIKRGRSISLGNIARNDTKNTISFRFPGISRKHCEIILKENTLLIKDLGSKNGTKLNEKYIEPGFEQVLHDGDKLTLGGVVTFKVRYYKGIWLLEVDHPQIQGFQAMLKEEVVKLLPEVGTKIFLFTDSINLEECGGKGVLKLEGNKICHEGAEANLASIDYIDL